MKKVLMICFVFPPRFSGAAFQAIALATALSNYGIKCDFFVPNYQNNFFLKKSEERWYNVYRVKKGIFFVFALLFFLIFNRKHYSIVHFHGISNIHFLCIFIVKIFNLKIVQKLTKGNEEENELNRGGRLRLFRWIAYKLIDRYVPISSALKKALINYGIPRHKINFISNGVDINLFQPLLHKNQLRSQFGFDAQDHLLVFIGTICPFKNLLTLLEIFNLTLIKLQKQQKNKTKLILVGPIIDTEYYAKLKSFIISKGIEEHIVFLGQVDKQTVSQLCSLSDIMMFTGMKEGCPNVLIEGKCTGISTIAFRAGGVEDIIIHGVDGYLIAPNNLNEFVDYTVKLLNDEKLRKKFAAAARLYCKKYSFDNIVSNYAESVYNLVK
ncbi:MAG: glycosyltransferase family 4 protein [Bacteroidales bacterium]|nr:glycosyltransferase family 4 protein [Bacteroidales bacterium]